VCSSDLGALEEPVPQGPWGSFEWFAGVDSVSVYDLDLEQSQRLTTYFLGHNWYANPHLKVTAQWQYLTAASHYFLTAPSDQSGQGLRISSQLKF